MLNHAAIYTVWWEFIISLLILQISKHSQKLKLAHDFYSYCFVHLLVIACAAFAIFYMCTHKDALHDVSGCILSHLPASVDILPCALLHSSSITSLLHYISMIRIVSSIARCKLKSQKSPGKLKIANISSESKIA